MSASYGARLALVCFASYFLANLLLTVMLRLCLPLLLRAVQNIRAVHASWLLFCARVAPGLLSLLFVLLFCVPSYLWLEPGSVAERTTLMGLAVAAFGVTLLCSGLWAAAVALLRSHHYLQGAHQGCTQNQSMLVVHSSRPLFALAGLLRPRLVISSELMESLTPEQFDMAVRHERAHQAGFDNVRKLVTLLSPVALPFSRGFAALDRQLAKFTEWAADDRAIAGDPDKAIALADALVRVARMSGTCGVPREALVSTLVSDDCSLDDRVLRLLNVQSEPQFVRSYGKLAIATATLLITGALWMGLPSTLAGVHAALERFFG